MNELFKKDIIKKVTDYGEISEESLCYMLSDIYKMLKDCQITLSEVIEDRDSNYQYIGEFSPEDEVPIIHGKGVSW